MSTKSPECWASDPNARGLRIELAQDRSLTLPYNLFLQSELSGSGNEQQLRFTFAAYEILIRGKCLRRIDTSMQRQELGFIAKVSGNARAAEDGQPVIYEITVKEVKPKKAERD
jgi:hypothetical protein